MDQTKIDTLKRILQKAGHCSGESIKEEAKDFLKSINEEDLIVAEQALIDEGMNLETMHHLCPAHMEILSEQIGNEDTVLEKDHPISVMMAEHVEILQFLDQLETLNWDIQTAKSFKSISKDHINQIKKIAQQLKGAENHHLREEDALFPVLEAKGINGPTTVMRNDHIALREAKKALVELSNEFLTLDDLKFEKMRAKLNELTDYLTTNLKEHIFKEDNILYPASLKSIKEDEWKIIHKKCDEIGYCDFTPGK